MISLVRVALLQTPFVLSGGGVVVVVRGCGHVMDRVVTESDVRDRAVYAANSADRELYRTSLSDEAC